MVSVGEPELLKQILVKDFHLFTDRKDRLADHPVISKNLFNSTGDDWRRYRSILSPTFSSGKMRQMFPIIRECLDGFEQALHERTGSTSSSSTTTSRPVTINAKEWTSSFTMDVIASCAFATKIQAYDSTGRLSTITNQSVNNPFVYHARRLLSIRWWSMLAMAILPKRVLMAIGLKWPVPERHNQFFFDLTRSVIRKRKQLADGTGSQQPKYTDFIQLMMNAEMIDSSSGGSGGGGVGDDDLNDTTEAHHVNDGNEEQEIERKILSTAAAAAANNKHQQQQKRLTETEIQAQGWVFFLAGRWLI
ncbi:cytochrome P450 3A11-like [Oppia nitens]|uniref:cytochrome P450 3A11-like n=1 Tax=Oppia nitens TaxID=1686743 RepID=UPI0023DB1BC7|nr:cytochrome P450 3A11-like [Oppia nitens]